MKKRVIFHFFKRREIVFLLLISIFISCSDKDDPSSVPDPTPENTVYVLKLKSSNQIEFKEFLGGKEKQDMAKDGSTYFGKRIQLHCPNELQFQNDSLWMVKTNNIVEKYKIKWQDNQLFLYNTNKDSWEFCGKKDQSGNFLLNTGFYIQKSTNNQRMFTIIGQEYNLISYSELMENNENESSSTIWLKMEYVFE